MPQERQTATVRQTVTRETRPYDDEQRLAVGIDHVNLLGPPVKESRDLTALQNCRPGGQGGSREIHDSFALWGGDYGWMTVTMTSPSAFSPAKSSTVSPFT